MRASCFSLRVRAAGRAAAVAPKRQPLPLRKPDAPTCCAPFSYLLRFLSVTDTDDPFIPIAEAHAAAAGLGSELVVHSRARHFMTRKVPELLRELVRRLAPRAPAAAAVEG